MVVSAFGPKAAEVAAGIADGFMSTTPDEDVLSVYRDNKERGPAVGALKVCWAKDEDTAVDLAHERWRNSAYRAPSHRSWLPSMFDEASSWSTGTPSGRSSHAVPTPSVTST